MAHFGILTPRLYTRTVPRGMTCKKNTMLWFNGKSRLTTQRWKHRGTLNVKNDTVYMYKSLCFKKRFRQILGYHPSGDKQEHTLGDALISSMSWNGDGLKNVSQMSTDCVCVCCRWERQKDEMLNQRRGKTNRDPGIGRWLSKEG